MNYIVRCRHCDKKNRVDEENLDKKIKCGHCNTVFKVTGGVFELDDNSYQFMINHGLNILTFYSDSCPHCVKLKKLLKDFSTLYPNIKFSRINTGFNQISPSKYSLRGVPTIIFIKDGKTLETIPGAIPENQFKEIINSIFKLNH